jgi:hypothetical protein
MTRGIAPRPESVAVPGADPVYSAVADLRTMGEAVCRITNSTNKVVTVTMQTALGDDPTFTKPNEAGDGFVGATDLGGISVTGFVSPATSSVSLAAGATTFARVSGAWSYARVKGVAAAVPGAGGTLGIAWGVKHRGD